jgi:hypothetical protein
MKSAADMLLLFSPAAALLPHFHRLLVVLLHP